MTLIFSSMVIGKPKGTHVSPVSTKTVVQKKGTARGSKSLSSSANDANRIRQIQSGGKTSYKPELKKLQELSKESDLAALEKHISDHPNAFNETQIKQARRTCALNSINEVLRKAERPANESNAYRRGAREAAKMIDDCKNEQHLLLSNPETPEQIDARLRVINKYSKNGNCQDALKNLQKKVDEYTVEACKFLVSAQERSEETKVFLAGAQILADLYNIPIPSGKVSNICKTAKIDWKGGRLDGETLTVQNLTIKDVSPVKWNHTDIRTGQKKITAAID